MRADCVSHAALALIIAFACSSSGAETSGKVSFVREIAPILSDQCLGCHQPSKARGGYRVHAFAAASKSGDSGLMPWIAGDPAKSEILSRLITQDPDDRMPQDAEPLAATQVDLFRRWILEGAVFDGPDPSLGLHQLNPLTPHPSPPSAYKHPFPIQSLVLSPDAKLIYAAGRRELAEVNAVTGRLTRRLTNFPERITSLVLLQDQRRIAVAGGSPGRLGEVRIADLREDVQPTVLLRSADMILALAVSPDSRWIAAGGCDASIRLFDPESGLLKKTLEAHSDWVTWLSFQPDGETLTLVTAGRDKTARAFRVPNGELTGAWLDATDPLMATVATPDGRHALSGGRDKRITRWDFADGKSRGTLKLPAREVLQLHRIDNVLWALLGDGCIHTGKLEQDGKAGEFQPLSVKDDELSSFAVSPDGAVLVAGSRTGRLYRWDLSQPEPKPIALGHPFPKSQ